MTFWEMETEKSKPTIFNFPVPEDIRTWNLLVNQKYIYKETLTPSHIKASRQCTVGIFLNDFEWGHTAAT